MAGLAAVSRNISQLPILRQLSFLVGLAASIAIGVYVAFWSQKPDYMPIAPGATLTQNSAILEVLSRANIPHKLDDQTGQVVVVSDKVQAARLQLAQSGVIVNEISGFELLDKDQGFAESQFVKQTKYFRAIQGELSKTISKIQWVQDARVQIAMPKQTSFVGSQNKVSASVFVNVYAGHDLGSNQVSAIVNLVANSVPGLSPQDVSVIDQNGNLLTMHGDKGMLIANENLEYQRKIESQYEHRILDLVEPIVGLNRVRAKVSAHIDFTATEETKENFDPNQTALRSEQIMSESIGSNESAVGIPGALSNQSPIGEGGLGGQNAAKQQATKNYEVNRSIQHVKLSPGKLQRLSVAVLVDEKVILNEEGVIESKVPLTQAEMNGLTSLIKDAIGYDESRGDKLSVINASFAPAPPMPIPETESWLESPWLPGLVKQGVAAMIIVFLLIVVVRPLFKGIAGLGAGLIDNQDQVEALRKAQLEVAERETKLAEAELNLKKERNQIKMIQELVNEDPKRVAQVVKNWVSNEGEG